MEACDSLIFARWVVPVVPGKLVLEDHAVAIRDGRILAVASAAEARSLFRSDHTVERPNHLLIPGLINAHTHSPMVMMRGFADDISLHDWLTKRVWPAENRVVSAEMVAAGTRLAVAEMLAGGTTTFGDQYFFPDTIGEIAAECGMRAIVGLPVIGAPTPWAQNIDEYLEKAVAVHDRFASHPLIGTQFAPHSPYMLGDDDLIRLRVLADQVEMRTQMHVHETTKEAEDSMQEHGCRPLERLGRLGLVNSQFGAVHMVDVTDNEIDDLAKTSASIVHCPESNAKLACGCARAADMLDAGINVALGTDGAASNNDLNMIGEMRSAALLAKLKVGDAEALPAHACLEMATINGARSLGLEAETGSLEPGKAADIASIDLHKPNTWPVYDPVSQLVYAADASQVTDTWVSGARVYTDGRHTTLKLTDTLDAGAQWQRRIAGTA